MTVLIVAFWSLLMFASLRLDIASSRNTTYLPFELSRHVPNCSGTRWAVQLVPFLRTFDTLDEPLNGLQISLLTDPIGDGGYGYV